MKNTSTPIKARWAVTLAVLVTGLGLAEAAGPQASAQNLSEADPIVPLELTIVPDSALQPVPYIGMGRAERDIMAEPKKGYRVAVESVIPESPAQQAGLKVGDILLSLNGESTKTEEEFGRIYAHVGPKPGDVLHYRVQRGAESRQIDVTVGSRTPDKKFRLFTDLCGCQRVRLHAAAAGRSGWNLLSLHKGA